MSRVILTADPGADLGQSSTASQGFIFYPNVQNLRGSNAIEQIVTVGLNQLTLIECVINGAIQFWQLQAGAADPAETNTEIAPLDYNASTNNVFWSQVGGFGVALMAAARVSLVNTTVSPASGVPTAFTFDTATFNSGEWSATSNPSRITAINDGIYALSGSCSFAANATGQRTLALRINGSAVIASEQINAAFALVPSNLTVSSIYTLQDGDYVELVATQTSGNNLQVLQANNYSPVLSAVRLSSLTPLENNPIISTSSTPPTTGSTLNALSIPTAGWYRIWSAPYPASSTFNIVRGNNGDGQTSDTVVDFTITAQTPEGIINVGRNAVPNTGSPSINGVRILHYVSTALAAVDVHLLRGGTWNLINSALDPNYIAAPSVVPDVLNPVPDGILTYALNPNVTGGTGKIDVPAINSSGLQLLAPGISPWTPATGTPSRVAFDTSTGTLTQALQHIKALEDDLILAGILSQGIPSSMVYAAMLSLTAPPVAENVVANDTDIFRVSVAPDTTVQGIYTPVGSFNGHLFYKVQGWEYETPGQNSPRQCYWSTAWSTWTISNASGNLYHSAATEASPWLVAQWKDQSSVNQTVTTVAPNVALTYNVLTDTHTAITVSGSSTGYNGLYLRGADLNAKRRYYLVGTGSNNKRIEWNGTTTWNIKDDSLTNYTAIDSSTFPDQVASTSWTDGINTDAIAVIGINSVDLMSGLTVGDITSTYNGIYVPTQGAYNVFNGRNLVYRRTDGVYYIYSSTSVWYISNVLGGVGILASDTYGNFPWNAAWTTANLTVQQNKIASPGWNNLATQPNTNISNNVIGNWHL